VISLAKRFSHIMLTMFKAYYSQQLMRPGLVGLFVNPFYFARRGLFLAVAEFAPGIGGHLLDVGCGSRPYETLFHTTKYVGLEIDTSNNRKTKKADVFYDGGVFPFDADSFDSVVCNQVLEHAFQPDRLISEISRILKPGGRLLITVPFVWDEHEQPWDYGRYSSFGLAALLKAHGFDLIAQRKTMGDVRTLFQLLNAYLFKVTCTRNPYLNLLTTIALMAPANLAGTLLYRILPRNPDLYLDNVVLAKKVNKL